MTQDKPFTGMLLMLGFCLLAPLGDALVKLLGNTISVGQIVLMRFALQALILLPLVRLSKHRWQLTPRLLKLTLLRTLLHIFGMGMMFTALRYLPIADAIAIAFVMPFIMLLLGKYILGETIGPHRFTACLIGFIGTLFVIQPSFAQVGWPAFLPLGVAVLFAFFMLVTRHIAKETDPIALQALSGVIAVIILLPVLVLSTGLQITALSLTSPTGFEWTLLCATGVLGTLAHLFMTWSLRFAPSATLAPMQYLEIPFATLIGLLVFDTSPNGLAATGIAITIGAGLYIIFRERATLPQRANLAKSQSPRPTSDEAECTTSRGSPSPM